MAFSLSYSIEAVLFSSETPVSIDELLTILNEDSREKIKKALAELQNFYEKNQRAFRLVQLGKTYQLQTDIEAKNILQKSSVVKVKEFSASVLETLAIIAYKQPVSRAQIDEIRGVESSYSIRLLLDRKLVAIAGRMEALGRPLLYKTTKKFLDTFNLQKISDLPSIKEWVSELAIEDVANKTLEYDLPQKSK